MMGATRMRSRGIASCWFQNERRRIRMKCSGGPPSDPITDPLGDEAVLLHLAPERDRADLQGAGRIAAIALKPLQRTLDRRPLQRLQVETVAQRSLTRLL